MTIETKTQHRRELRRRWLRALLILTGVLLVGEALVGERGMISTVRARTAYHELRAELVLIRGENARLRERARQLREDRWAIEELARRELGMIKPGEKVFIVRDVAKR